jgi:hypothetical protein
VCARRGRTRACGGQRDTLVRALLYLFQPFTRPWCIYRGCNRKKIPVAHDVTGLLRREFYAPNDRFAAALNELRSRNFSDEDLLDAAERLGLGRTSHGESDGSLANAAGPGKRAGRAGGWDTT